MSVNSHIHEYDDTEVDSFLSECGCRLSDSEAAEKFLHGIYPDDSDPDDDSAYDMDKGENDPVFTIKVVDNSMDDYYEENYLKIHLPNRDAADELAAIVGGDVVDDETKDDDDDKGHFFISGFHHLDDGDEIIQVHTIFNSREDAAEVVADIVNDTIGEDTDEYEPVTSDDCLDGYTLEKFSEKLCIKVVDAK